MPRRSYRNTFRCAHDGGCSETVTYGYEFRRDQADGYRRNAASPWKCARHARPGEYLRPGNESTERVLIATRLPSGLRPGEFLDGLYWCPESGPQHGSGFTSGPGFVADTREFPEGTRLVVATRIEMPTDTETTREQDR